MRTAQTRLRTLLLTLVLGGGVLAQTTLTPVQEARAQAIGQTLRCPVCTGLPITESSSDLSHEMLRDLRAQVAAGQSEEQIVEYFTSRYGDTVRLKPAVSGAGLLLWLGPLAALLGGGAVLALYLRRPRVTPATSGPATPEPDEPDSSDGGAPPDPYLARVRAIKPGQP